MKKDVATRLTGKTIIAPNGQIFTIQTVYHLPDEPKVRLMLISDLIYPDAHKLADFLEGDDQKKLEDLE